MTLLVCTSLSFYSDVIIDVKQNRPNVAGISCIERNGKIDGMSLCCIDFLPEGNLSEDILQ